jgi:creatinine amidohydrolase
MPAADKYLYADLTWPEVNEAVAMGKVILLPVGSTEQHGHHLPLDVDNLLASSVCLEAGRRQPDKILVAPTIPYGFNIHAMDFPGTIHVAYDHFVEFCLDVVKSFAYHGFKRIVIVDGHGSNEHLLEFVGRRAVLETDALVASFMWWNMLRVDPAFLPSVRESVFPGGAAHACEIETSLYLHLCPEKVQMDKAEDCITFHNQAGATGFRWFDAFGGGPVRLVEWTSSYTPSGVVGQPTLATAEKGGRILDEAVGHLLDWVTQFQAYTAGPRVGHHATPPSSPLPPT